MLRDFSPTYYFRVRRAEQLLAMYRSNPARFETLASTYKSDFVNAGRAPHRLSVWLRRDDLVFHNADDIRSDVGKRLARAIDLPSYYGYALKLAPDVPDQASPAALGTLVYIAFETRRLYEAISRRAKIPAVAGCFASRSARWRHREGRGDPARLRAGFRYRLFRMAAGRTGMPALRFGRSRVGWDTWVLSTKGAKICTLDALRARANSSRRCSTKRCM
jgi:hypothetical protein